MEENECFEFEGGFVCYDDKGNLTIYSPDDEEIVIFQYHELESLLPAMQRAYDELKKIAALKEAEPGEDSSSSPGASLCLDRDYMLPREEDKPYEPDYWGAHYE